MTSSRLQTRWCRGSLVDRRFAAACHYRPKRVSLPISANPPTCGNGITRHSHERGDGPDRGTKLSCGGPEPRREGRSGCTGRLKVRSHQTEVSSGVGARIAADRYIHLISRRC